MENRDNNSSNFWLGFVLGIIAAGSAAYFFGTKNGRKQLQQILELSDNLEENVGLFIEEMGEEFRTKGEEELKKIQNEVTTSFQKEQPALHKILDKIRVLSPQTGKKDKKLFIKE